MYLNYLGCSLLFLLLCGVNPEIFSQQTRKISVYIDQVKSGNQFTNVRDSNELTYLINSWIRTRIREGYLLAGIDSVKSTDEQLNLYLHQGKTYSVLWLPVSEDSIRNRSRFKVSKNRQIFPDSMDFLELDREFGNYLNTGYPFARFRIDSTLQSGDSIYLHLYIDKGPYIYFSQPEQRNHQVLKNYVLNRITGIYPGQAYSEDKFRSLAGKMRRLNFIGMESEPRNYFLGFENKIWLYLLKEKRSRFDLLLGLNSFEGPAGREYRLTGQAGVDLINGLRMGERFYLNYENLNENAPKFKMGFNFPYLPYWPFGVAADFGVFRFAEEYIDLSLKLKLEFKPFEFQKVAVNFTLLSSGLLNPDTLFLKNTGKLPSTLDYNYKAYSLIYSYNSLDYPFNPRGGTRLESEIQYGLKSYPRNASLTKYDSDSISVHLMYDSLDQNKEQLLFSFLAEYYQPVFSRSVLKILLEYNSFFGKASILKNEMFRLGGFKRLRGFDDDFLYSSAFTFGTLEYRFLLDKDSYLNIFYDAGYLRQEESSVMNWNFYSGLGAGIQFQTKIGLFSLSYAIGKSKYQKFELGNGKIHFGYTALF